MPSWNESLAESGSFTKVEHLGCPSCVVESHGHRRDGSMGKIMMITNANACGPHNAHRRPDCTCRCHRLWQQGIDEKEAFRGH